MNETTSPSKQGKRRRWMVGMVVVLLALLVAGPWIVARTGLRDVAINAILDSPHLTATSDGASFGWFSAMSLDGLELTNDDRRLRVTVDAITTNKAWWGHWANAPDLGTVTLDQPHVHLDLPLEVSLKPIPTDQDDMPTYIAVMRDAGLTVRVPSVKEPVIHVDDIDVTFQVERTDSGRQLSVAPTTIFDKVRLTPDLSDDLLQLANPVLADVKVVEGAVSLSLSNCTIPIRHADKKLIDQIEVEGVLGLHQVTTSVKTPLLQAMIKVLADLYGKQTKKVVRVVQEGNVKFRVHKGRIFHEGLQIGFPDISPDLVIRSSGTVGLDESLNLRLEVPRLLAKPRTTEKQDLELLITGTISRPRITVRGATLAVRMPGRAEPIFDIDHINLSFQVKDTAAGKQLALDPVTIFDKQKLTAETGDDLLQLVAPVLADVVGVEGQVSLSINRFLIPLQKGDMVKGIQVEGVLGLHQVKAEVKTPLLQAMVKVLADLYHKKATNVVRVIDNTEISYSIRSGRIYHEGLEFGFPDISPDLVVRSTGSIGLDESLDLHIAVPSVLVEGKDDPKSKKTVRFHITGSLKEPIVTRLKD